MLARLTSAAIAVTAIAGTSAAGPAGSASRTAAVTAASATPAYVALGDSYASGEGLGSYQAGTDVKKGRKRNVCHRSPHAYSSLTPHVVLPSVTSRVSWACSGATAVDMMGVPPQSGKNEQYRQPAQVGTVGPATQWISISAGGDDLGFGDVGRACAEVIISHKKVVRFSSTTCAKELAFERGRISQVQASLAKLYTGLLKRAPNAALAVVGYPRVLPPRYKGVPTLKGSPFCVLDHYDPGFTVDVGMPVSDAKDVDGFIVAMNAMIKAAISKVKSASPGYAGRISFVDTYGPSVPHNCKGTTPQATVAAFEISAFHGVGSQGKSLVSTATFHPTKAGQDLFARQVESAFLDFSRPTPLSKLRWSAPERIDLTQGLLANVSCVSASFCMAIDQNGNYLTYNGATWSGPTPIFRHVTGQGEFGCNGSCLDALDCPTTSFCLAGVDVGRDDYLAYQNGIWSGIKTIPVARHPFAGSIQSISCSNASYCVFTDGDGNIYALDNGSWSRGPVLSPSGGNYPVSCTAAKFCAVVGQDSYVTSNAGTWSAVKNLPTPFDNEVGFVTCASASACLAGGNENTPQTWSGSTWADATLASTNTVDLASCTAADFCLGVGESADGSELQSTVFNGSSWSAPVSIGPVVTSSDGSEGAVSGLSCTGESCTTDTFSGYQARYRSGAWSAPVQIDAPHFVFQESCASPAFCALVDLDGYAETFNGTKWSAPVMITTGAAKRDANGFVYQPATISCPVAGWCLATTGSGSVMTYSNGHWTKPTAPGTVGFAVGSLSCVSRHFCVADDGFDGLAYIYNGAGWTATSYESPSRQQIGSLVSCVSATFCLLSADASFVYNGKAWRKASAQGGGLFYLSCASAVFCAGYPLNSMPQAIDVFNGSRWHAVQTPVTDTITSLDCPAANDCLAGTESGAAYTFDGKGLWPAGTLDPGIPILYEDCTSTSWCQVIDDAGFALTGTKAR